MNAVNDFFRWLLFLPPQSSTVARGIDSLHYAVITATMLGATLVFFVALAFVIRYRARSAPGPTPRLHAPRWLEGLFVAGTLPLFILFWQIGFGQYVHIATAPRDTLDVHVSAKQWMWKYAYPDGASSIATVFVPAGRPVRLILTSRDVIHSFFVPDFRLKQDVIPGRVTTLWFQADEPGVHEVLCAEYCGTDHSMMRGQVVVLAPADYAAFLGGRGPRKSMADEGREVAIRHGCLRCHTVDGTANTGPTWVGLYRNQRRFSDGTAAVADEAYLTASMMDPTRQVVAGFLPLMPVYQGFLSAGETAALVEYIKSLERGGQVP